MKIDGRLIAEEIKDTLRKKIKNLHITPHLAVIIVGQDPSSLAYIRQKIKTGESIGAKVSVTHLSSDDLKGLLETVEKLNSADSVHGIIIQKPVPINIGKEKLNNLVLPKKDVDGFCSNSSFTPPIAKAIEVILKKICGQEKIKKNIKSNFFHWLKEKSIVVIGRGETGGQPIANYLKKINDKVTIAHSQTLNLKELLKSSDILVSCVGKPNIVRHDMVNSNTILIGVGMHTEDDHKLRADYNLEEIAGKAAYYTPVPGGVGPVNVACLFENLVKAVATFL